MPLIRVKKPNKNLNDLEVLLTLGFFKPGVLEIFNTVAAIPQYETKYKRCPILSGKKYDFLKDKYSDYRNTLKDLFFDDINYCHYCGRLDALHIDHFHPISSAAEYSIHLSNLLLSCSLCNQKKGDLKPLSDLNLHHPYLSRVYEKNEFLWTVSISDIEKDCNDDILIIVKIDGSDNLPKSQRKKVINTLKRLGAFDYIKKRIEHNLFHFCRKVDQGLSASQLHLKAVENAQLFYEKQYYLDYISEKLLSIEVLDLILKLKFE